MIEEEASPTSIFSYNPELRLPSLLLLLLLLLLRVGVALKIEMELKPGMTFEGIYVLLTRSSTDRGDGTQDQVQPPLSNIFSMKI